MVVLLPMFSKVWRAIIEGPPMVRSLFHDYSTMSGLAMANLYILMALFPVRSRHIKGLPGRASIFFAYRNVMEMEIFPKTRKEGRAYWADANVQAILFAGSEEAAAKKSRRWRDGEVANTTWRVVA